MSTKPTKNTTKEALVTILVQGADPIPLPEPTGYSGTTSTLVDAGTSVSGHLLGAVVREDAAQVSLSWSYLPAEDWARVNRIFKGSHVNPVRFFDQTLGDWNQRDMYPSDRGAGMWRRGEDGSVLGWTGCSLQLTEV
jgi:hypothetical protein